jgi:hypothetical protein
VWLALLVLHLARLRLVRHDRLAILLLWPAPR